MPVTPSVGVILSDLIDLESVNPALKGAVPGGGEERVAKYVADRGKEAGLSVTMQPVLGGRSNTVIHYKPEGAAGMPILLSAHMDTYPWTQGEPSGHRWSQDGLTVLGRGAADAKASLAAMLSALLTVSRIGVRQEVIFAATVDEEYGLGGARRLADLGIHPAVAITGEPTRLVPIVAQKGILRYKIEVAGPRVHAAYPSTDSSMACVGRILSRVERFGAGLRQGDVDPDNPEADGPASVTVTQVYGDGDMNTVARRAWILLDVRYPPGVQASRLHEELRLAVERDEDGTVMLGEPYFESPSNDARPPAPQLESFLRVVQERTMKQPETFSYGSEAGVLSSFCAQAIVFGPGDPKYSHGPDEQVEIAEVEEAADILTYWLEDGVGC